MSTEPSGRFAPTRWTRVMAARASDPEGVKALSDLCADYYEPVHAFILQSSGNPETARDLTHDFFARLLSRPSLGGVDPARGKFRSYLLGAVKHFLHDDWEKRQAQRRGAGEDLIPLEDLSMADEVTFPSDAIFDREWAIALVNRALDDLEDECEEDGRGDLFDALKPWLTGNIDASQAEIATTLEISEGAVKVAIHRLRKRYREMVSAQLSHTLMDPHEAADEMQHLIRALGAAAAS
ncbi:MAG: polymerase sigma factor [Akkermansiaceae bacterium]|nr:polymerase sigma factor [Akkermansiaceae bacterium]